MSPRDLDPEVLHRRLVELDRLLTWLSELGTPSGEDLRTDWRTRLAVERILEQIVELAVGINLHISRAGGIAAGDTYRDSFGAAATAGAIDADLARQLAPSAGLRNLLVHAYLDIDHDQVAAAIPSAVERYTRFRHEVAVWLDSRRDTPGDTG